MPIARHPVRSARAPERGVTLIIMLIMLVVITMVTLSSMRSTTMTERMAGNSRDRQRAFQAAEAAVQTCLKQLNAGGGAYAGAMNTPAATNATPLWEVAANWASTSAVSTEVDVAGMNLTQNPRCLVETLDTLGSYRVTGRAVGGSADTVVVLQATYSTQ